MQASDFYSRVIYRKKVGEVYIDFSLDLIHIVSNSFNSFLNELEKHIKSNINLYFKHSDRVEINILKNGCLFSNITYTRDMFF